MKLGELVNIKTGKLDANAAVENGQYPFFTTAREISRIDKYSFDDEVVLVAGNGDLNVKYYKGKFDAYQRTYVLTCKKDKELNMKYLYYFMEKYLGVLRQQAIGCVIKYIKLENLTEPNIYYPSIETQTQIAQILDKSTALIAKRKAQIAELDDLISACYKNVLSKSEKRCVKISNVVRDISTGKSYASLEDSPYKVLKTSAVSYGFFNENEVKNLPINYTPPPEHLLRKGDILVSRMNTEELVGASAFVWKDYSNIAIPDRLWKLHLVDSVNPIFIWKTLQQDFFRKSIRVNSSGTSGSMKNISQANFMNLEIYLPDLKTQIQFAQIAEKIHAQKSLLQKSLAELEVQHQALMQKAFNGQLVG